MYALELEAIVSLKHKFGLNDIKGGLKNFNLTVIRFVNSPLKTLGLLKIIFGLTISILTYGYLIVLGLIFIGIGLSLYFIDFLSRRYFTHKRIYWRFQYSFTLLYFILAFIAYMKWQEHNYIVIPKDYKGQAGIIFGIEGYPELPNTKFWRKTIKIPEDGILITSTKVKDIPNNVRFAFSDNSNIDYSTINWEPDFEIDCIVCDSKIISWLFLVGSNKNPKVKEKMNSLCNEIASNRKSSFYKSEHSTIVADNKGKYLSLQDKGLTSLPEGLGKLNIYKAILTGNDFDEIPKQILELRTLEELIFAVNPINEFPCNLSMLYRLKRISFANTGIKEINCDLSQLDSLEHLDLARNSLTKFPEQIKTIPNLTWLSINDNQFSNISFVDISLKKLETLYLYSNKIKSISVETKYLVNLKELLIFDNEIDSIPNNISDLKHLEKLEIWNNPIKYISPSIAGLTNLKTMRLDDDYLTQADKENLKKWLPYCEINFQTRSDKKSTQ